MIDTADSHNVDYMDGADFDDDVAAGDVPCAGVGAAGGVGGVLRWSFSLRVCMSIQKLGTTRVPMKAFIAMPRFG